MNICHPSTIDWGCLTEAQQAQVDDPVNADAVERSVSLAWTSLQMLTGYRLSICPTTVRPCSGSCWAAIGSSYIEAPVGGFGQPFIPYIRGGNWFNFCGCGVECNCGPRLERVFLPSIVGGIDEVRIDGEVVPASAYRVDNGNQLIRLDGDEWPSCQDMTAGVDDENTFFVRYFEGAAPNDLFAYAAGVLAWEFFLSCTGSTKCKLPSGVTSIVRQGVSMTIENNLWTNGKSGIDEVDRVVALLNPQGLRQAPQIWNPESLASAPRRTSWSV